MVETPREDGIIQHGDEVDIDSEMSDFYTAEANLVTNLPATQHLQIRVLLRFNLTGKTN